MTDRIRQVLRRPLESADRRRTNSLGEALAVGLGCDTSARPRAGRRRT